jgi:hypothetical protein
MYKVAIKKNDTGEVHLCEMDLNWEDHSEWWWTEGNMGCDCNRELQWLRAANENPSLGDVKCSDNRFTVLYAKLPDGTKIEIDDEEK